jgi:hypothetical protein
MKYREESRTLNMMRNNLGMAKYSQREDSFLLMAMFIYMLLII